MSETLLDETIAVIARHCDIDAGEITPETEIEELGLHSLELTEILMDLEERYDVDIDLSTVEAWSSLKTIRDVVDKVAKVVQSGTSAE